MNTNPPAPLSLLIEVTSQWINQSILNLMAARGFGKLTEPHLNLLANLQCGVTQASAVAQQMGVSRQAIYRTTQELQALGYLVLVPDPDQRNQKRIEMTEAGMRLAINAREVLTIIEAEISDRVGMPDFLTFRNVLEANWGPALG